MDQLNPNIQNGITLDSEKTASDEGCDAEVCLQLISGTSTLFATTLSVDMNLEGGASSSVQTVDNSSGEEIITETKVTLPLGMDLNMNKDASLSISKGFTALVNGAYQTGTSLTVDGTTATPATGTRFVIMQADGTASSDTTIYETIAGSSATSWNLNQALASSPVNNAVIVLCISNYKYKCRRSSDSSFF